MILRYYTDAEISEWHNHAPRLLKALHGGYGITVEIDRIGRQHGLITDFPGEVRYPTPKDVYERDLKHNRELNQIIEQTPSEVFKHYGELDIAGNISVTDGGDTAWWASILPSHADGYRLDAESRTAIDFLEDIAASPSNRLCIEYLSLLDGDESSCPNCGYEVS